MLGLFKKPPTPTITAVWIHGANQTPLSFAYLKSQTNFPNQHFVNYSSSNSFAYNLKTMTEELSDFETVFLIGHSLGGLYALHLSQYLPTAAGVTISTPYKGSATADWAKYLLPNYQLFKDIGRRSKPITDAEQFRLTVPWCQIVSVKGSVPYHESLNDGVVTVASMTARTDMEIVKLPYNHYEIVCADTTAAIIKSRYEAVQAG